MRVQYSSNNSGGDWWLSDADWIGLADAGWEVVWGSYYFCGKDIAPVLTVAAIHRITRKGAS